MRFVLSILFVAVSGVVLGGVLTAKLTEVDLDDRILRFGKKIQCPDPEYVASTTFDLRTGEYTCRYFRRYLKETKR